MTQRDFGGHRYARLAHVGDRTGLEIIRTLQQKVVSMGIEVFMECKILRLLADGEGRVSGAVGYWRATGDFITFSAKVVVLATGSIGKSWMYTSNSRESTGDGHAMAIWAGADVIEMECVQFHPTSMVWPSSVRGLLVTEGVRGDGGALRNSEGKRFMFDYVAPMFRSETAETEDEADRWYDDHINNRRPADLLPRDEVARAINTEVKVGRGSPHGGVFLDIASRRSADYIRRRLPGMYHQFMELAGVDITTTPMEVAPTCHYMMGGVRVDAETEAATIPGLFAAGEVVGGMHGANRLGGNSLSDLLVFGRRVGIGASDFAEGRTGEPTTDDAEIEAVAAEALAPLERDGGENPYDIQHDLQTTMQSLVGIVRNGPELEEALEKLAELKERTAKISVGGGRAFNPGWNLATDLPAMLTVSTAVAQGALHRKESRGGHTREDYPNADPEMGKVNFVQCQTAERGPYAPIAIRPEPLPVMPPELAELFEDSRMGRMPNDRNPPGIRCATQCGCAASSASSASSATCSRLTVRAHCLLREFRLQDGAPAVRSRPSNGYAPARGRRLPPSMQRAQDERRTP